MLSESEWLIVKYGKTDNWRNKYGEKIQSNQRRVS